MTLDLAQLFYGRGDAWAALWIVEGARALGMRPRLYTHHPEVCEPWFPADEPPLPADMAPDGAAVLLGRHNEWRATLTETRLAMMARRATEAARAQGWCGADILPVQPVLRLPVATPVVPEWAALEPLDAARTVMLFPRGEWSQRDWPLVHWQRLHSRLAADGWQVVTLGGAKHAAEVSAISPRWATQLRVSALVGLVQASAAVISGDSGPLHLAAALGRPAVSVHAMMRAEALTGHYPGSVSVCPSGPCAGCHSQAALGYDAAVCGKACSALATVPPQAVFEAFKRVVGGV